MKCPRLRGPEANLPVPTDHNIVGVNAERALLSRKVKARRTLRYEYARRLEKGLARPRPRSSRHRVDMGPRCLREAEGSETRHELQAAKYMYNSRRYCECGTAMVWKAKGWRILLLPLLLLLLFLASSRPARPVLSILAGAGPLSPPHRSSDYEARRCS